MRSSLMSLAYSVATARAAFFSHLGDDAFGRYATETLRESGVDSHALIVDHRRSTSPPRGYWAVEVKETGTVAGSVLLLTLPDAEHEEVEIGWHLHPDSWGHGYASEAAAAVLDFGFAAGLPEVYAVVRPGNEASLAVCRRLGMTPLGRFRRWYDVELEAFRLMAPAVVE